MNIDARMVGETDNAETTPQDSQDRSVLTHRRLLGARLYIHTWVRLLIAFAIAPAALVGQYIELFDPDALDELVILALAIIAYDIGAWILFRRYRNPQRSAAANRMLQNTMLGTIVLDHLALTVFLWLTGGTHSPFIAFYLPHIVMSHLLLSSRRAAATAVYAFLLLVTLVFCEYWGVLSTHTPFGSSAAQPGRALGVAVTVVAVYGALFALMSLFMIELTRKLRGREAKLHRAHAEARRLSTLREDFLRIVMHNLRAPVGAVTMLLRNMHTGLGGALTDKQEEWVDRSLRRLNGVSTFLHDLQMLSVLDDQALRAQHNAVDVGALLQSLVHEYQDLAEARRHELSLELAQDLPPINGIERLLREALVNYLTNAIKYTPAGGHILVRAGLANGKLRLAVRDDGPGISTEDQARLFHEFVRVGKQQDPQTGTGLGLFIVRRIAEAHGGMASVESVEGAGSTFVLELPVPGDDAPATE